MMEAADASDDETDVTFVEQIRSEIAGLIDLASNLDVHDPKVEAFVQVLKDKGKMANNKALVFSTFRHTLTYLCSHAEHTGLRYGRIHGSIPDEERAALRRRFALPKDDANAIDVLLSSEVGCEGLDFQFCDFLVNYDLPWNPMRIEQRIGRIDRYGQKSETVAIVNFVTPGTVDADIYQRCLLRIGVFQHAIGGNEEILGQITKELHDIAESFTLSASEREQRLRQLSDNSIRQIQEEQALEAKQSELFGLNVPSEKFRKEVESADSFWLSPAAIQRCVAAYLTGRVGGDSEHVLGDKAQKTLRLNEDARQKLLQDFRDVPRATDPTSREWERWLKDSKPTAAVTFDQDAASDVPSAFYLSVMHPLVRQAARFLQIEDAAYVSLGVNSDVVAPGEYRFALYRWSKRGVKDDELLVPVATNAKLEDELLRLLATAYAAPGQSLPSPAEFDDLDTQHHSKWTAATANHIAENRLHVDHRIQSLTVSHRARCKAIEDQIGRAANDKIRLMKQSELARADSDCKRHLAELERAATSGDIHSKAVIFGVLTVQR